MRCVSVILTEIYKYGTESRHNSFNLPLHQARHWGRWGDKSGEREEGGRRMINQKIGKPQSGGSTPASDNVNAIFVWVCRLLTALVITTPQWAI